MIYKFNNPGKPVDIAIFAGHGSSEKGYDYDPGAVGAGGVKEATITKYLALEVATMLSDLGLDVFYDEQNFKDKDLEGINIKSKWALSLHINAGGGTGTEILVPAGESNLRAETKMLEYMTKLGYRSRGLKSRNYDTGQVVQRVDGAKVNFKDYYGEIRDAWSRGISLSIIEFLFIDSIDDLRILKRFYSVFADILVYEIYKEIKGTYPNLGEPQPSTPKKTYVYLPKDNNTWRIYNVNGPYTVGNEIAMLRPAKFGGLEYEVIRWIKTNEIAVIKTEQFGEAAIYVARSTGAIIKTK